MRRASFDTVRALVRHIERYIAEWNAHPTPFVWTKEPADIVKKAIRRAREHDFSDGASANTLRDRMARLAFDGDFPRPGLTVID